MKKETNYITKEYNCFAIYVDGQIYGHADTMRKAEYLLNNYLNSKKYKELKLKYGNKPVDK